MATSSNIPQYFLQLCTYILVLQVLTSSSLHSTCDDDHHELAISFPKFKPSNCKNGGGLLCMGTVTPGDGFLNLTKSDYISSGRVLYHVPVQIWPASFCTSFSFKIFPHFNHLNFSGDGMTFVMAQDNKFDPNQGKGSYLGLLDPLNKGNTQFQQLAIEMDVFKNEWDPDDNHIAIDTLSAMKHLIVKSLNTSHIDLKSEKQIRMKVMYNGWTKLLQIYVGYEGYQLTSLLNYSIEVSKIIPKHVYIGFTASTGLLFETHQLLDWAFTSTILPYNSLKGNTSKKVTILESVLPVLGCLVLFVVIGVPICRRRMMRKRERVRRMEELERQYAAAAATPWKFTYKQLAKATKNFSEDNLLGSGGFGSVYKGHIVDPPKTIAVKKISATSQQGEREYLAEICTIGRLRHKNILQLQGWSHENEQLLLVYDYMPNKSLNGFLTGKSFLDWKTRWKILTGLASAILYLHEECGDPVVHRDIKPSNVMLDEEFNPYLGDFGLARLLKNARGVTTKVAGTIGYMAPELFYTGKATTESDVYSFGVLALEVVSGKRANDLIDEDCCFIDYVWDMHTKGCLVECVDHNLGENFDKDQATRILNVALACLDLDSNMRPKMREVVTILSNSDEPLMKLPGIRSRGVYVSLRGVSFTHSASSPSLTLTDYPSCSTNSNVLDESLVR